MSCLLVYVFTFYSPRSNGLVNAAGCATIERAAKTSATIVKTYGIINAMSDEIGTCKTWIHNWNALTMLNSKQPSITRYGFHAPK